MPAYQITRLLFGPYHVQTQTLHRVELRNKAADTADELETLEKSRKSFALRAGIIFDDVEYSRSTRISTIIEANNRSIALESAQLLFDEALDVLTMSLAITRYSLIELGWIRDLLSGKIEPIEPVERDGYRPLKNIYVNTLQIEPMSIETYVLADKLGPEDEHKRPELASRILRSAYWFRRGRKENNVQLRALFRWFGIESIWIIPGVTDAASKAAMALGFPGKQTMLNMRDKAQEIQKKIADYDKLAKMVRGKLELIEKYRHESVHNGARVYDKNIDELLDYSHITYYACLASQHFARVALENYNLKTVSELRENTGKIFAAHLTADAVANTASSLRDPESSMRWVDK